ncbi:MAG: helix-turn-helix domain-containing protein [Candidatus Omnitrophota bacterium]
MLNIGETLRKKRESKKITLEDVYRATRIPPHVLSLLEKEEFDKLAGVLYVKSFLKKYAEFLGLDSKEIVNAYVSSLSQSDVSPQPKITPPSPKRPLNKKLLSRIIIGISLVALLIFRLSASSRKLPQAKKEKVEKRTSEIKRSKEFIIPRKETLILKIKAKKDTWIQLKSDGEIVFQHILKAGSEDSWKAKERFELWVGEASNLNLFLNEIPLEIKGKGVQRGIIIDHTGLHRNIDSSP